MVKFNFNKAVNIIMVGSVIALEVWIAHNIKTNHTYGMTTDNHITYNEEVVEIPVLEEEIDHNALMEEEVAQAIEEDYNLEEDFRMARGVQAEAGGEALVGMVAVATTMLNRADSYNMSMEEVLSVGYCNPAPYASAEAMEAVRIARANRDLFPRNMMYFSTECYHTFDHAEDYVVIGHHWFSLNDLYDRETGEKL
jgi:hypothetical protein